MTVSKSGLTKAKTPIQRKRLLSVAAAINDEQGEKNTGIESRTETRGWGDDESGCDIEKEGEIKMELKRLDSETGQTIISTESKESGVCVCVCVCVCVLYGKMVWSNYIMIDSSLYTNK